MSDETGNLLFSSNGCKVINSQGEIMENGDSINPGLIQDIYCPSGGSPLIQGVIAIPSPEGDSIFYVFNVDFDQPYLLNTNFLGLAPQRLFYQKVDMAQDSGYGAVVLKNQIAVFDTLARGNIQAVKHTNGQDWWIIVPKSHSNCYFLVPVTSEGVQPAQLKCAGKIWNDQDLGAQVTFSPDSKKYIRFNAWNGLNIFDFDAATGDLYNPVHIDFSNDTINSIAGVAVSPNSKYLYVCARKNIYQFNLQGPDIETSKVKIATWDGYFNPYATIFYLAALAPDGKIYISNTSSTYNLHVIHKPNCPGLSCQLEQHGIVLPSYNYATIPNLPHYNILDTSYDCDTSISTEVANAADKLLLFPNPATDQLHIIGLEGNAVITIIDVSGKKVFLKKGAWPSKGQETIDISAFAPGLYFVSVQQKGSVQQAKIVKQ
ncbi:MAG: T9SS type A sorting domain-containing protein [Saprospiraceae bacterium]